MRTSPPSCAQLTSERIIHRCSTRATIFWAVLLLTTLLITISPTSVVAQSRAKAKTTPTKIFGGKVLLAVPTTAQKPKKISSLMYSIQPRATTQKFVIFVTKEPLRKDERTKSNKDLGTSIKQLLEAQGYEVTSLKNKGTTYTALFRAYTNVPWQKVGTTATRGTAKFVRTSSNELVGSMLLCDPNQWSDPGIALYKKAVSSAKVSNK